MWVRGHSRSLKLVPFKSLGAVSYSSSLVTMTVSVSVCETFSVKGWCDLENSVRDRSRSLEMAPFDRSHTRPDYILHCETRCKRLLYRKVYCIYSFSRFHCTYPQRDGQAELFTRIAVRPDVSGYYTARCTVSTHSRGCIAPIHRGMARLSCSPG